ncbi:MAG: ribulose-phosphate 3-epimerase [Candidatus Diapherotrites archaeon]|nr:ribulose-phosphate 3-epimerase [Candidatus Micrarchaeota archaeon]MBU1939661.1 ribulose-phosphate 3-epimerase [Candidatus Micrarchaeota archaeon]
MAKVGASILSADEKKLKDTLRALEEAGIDELHWDIMDGLYVGAKKFGSEIVAEMRKKTKLFFDVHLMVKNPDDVINDYAEAGANAITFHIETVPDAEKTIDEITWHDLRAGIAINNMVPVQKALPLLGKVGLVLVMTVEAGEGGQGFIEKNLEKVRTLRKEIDKGKHDCIIAVDGGINEETGRLAVEAGADLLCTGSYIIHAKDMKQAVEALKKL